MSQESTQLAPEVRPKKQRRSTGPRATENDVFVGQRLRTARKLAEVTQQQLAAALGVTFQAVQKYEQGENRISAPQLFKAARFLGTDINFFTFPMNGAPAGIDRTSLDDEEIALVRHYRRLSDPRTRMLLRKLVEAIAQTETAQS
jgi:transcriptional regulator with XRE-family HTH domain